MKRNWVGWVLLGICVASVIAIFWMLVAHNVELQNRLARAEGAVVELVVQNRGPQGPDGAQGEPGREPTPEEILVAVETYCASHNGCVGASGKDGTPGAVGAPGVPGVAGQSVTRVTCHSTFVRFWSGSNQIGDIKMVCIP